MKLIILLLVSIVSCQVMVIGKMGVGKSYLINALLGETIAKESYTDDIGTTNLSSYNYKGISIFDTPGLFEPGSDTKTILKHYIEKSKPSILIVCFDSTEKRLSDQDLKIVTILKTLFGDKILEKTIFTLTQVNRVCMLNGESRMKDIITSKKSTLLIEGAINLAISGDKDNILCSNELKPQLGRLSENGWMEDFWSTIKKIMLKNPTSIINMPYIQPSGVSKKAFQQTMNNDGCIDQNTKLGGMWAYEINAGDYIKQNGEYVKVLFTYKHDQPMYMMVFKGGSVTGEHYIFENGEYIKAKDSQYSIGCKYSYTMYIVTELEDLYFDSGFIVSTYVWNYWIMRILHIPFRIIMNMIV